MAVPAINLELLTTEERLSLLDQIWESLTRSTGSLPLTTPQREDLNARLDHLEQEGPVGVPWGEVVKRVRGRSA